MWRAVIGDGIGPKPWSSKGRRHHGDSAGLWLEAPGGGQTEPPGHTVATAARTPFGRVLRTVSSRPGVHAGLGEAEPTQ